MINYEVNNDTIAVVGINSKNSKIIEENNEYLINESSYSVMDYSCNYFGSSYLGRVDGSKNMLKANYKLPIIVEESSELIFFPICSPENEKCIWVNIKWIEDVIEINKKVYIILKNNKKIECFVSKNSIKNQMLRAIKLNYILNERKIEKIS